jgi:hypothetical protein
MTVGFDRFPVKLVAAAVVLSGSISLNAAELNPAAVAVSPRSSCMSPSAEFLLPGEGPATATPVEAK